MAKLRIFLADDHPVVRAGLRTLINAQDDMEVVGEAADGPAAVEGAVTLRPDVAVLDISMPGLNGIRVTEQILQTCPNLRVLALTVHEDRNYLRQLLAAGAVGYVLKRAAAEELILALRTVVAGGVYLDPALAGQVVTGFVRRPVPDSQAELSDREEEVLRLLALGYSNKEIAARLELSVKTVETYKSRSLEKLGLSSRADIVRYALQCGWLQAPLADGP